MIGLTENSDSLLKWILSGPDVAAFVEQFEEGYGLQQDMSSPLSHHNDTPAENATFRKHVAALKRKFEDRGNPFLEKGEELYNVDNGKVVDRSEVDSILKIEEVGNMQYTAFVEERLESGNKSLYDPILKNNFKLMAASTKNKVVTKIACLKSDISLFSRLWMATQVRKGDMTEFFKHENQSLPPSLTSNGAMRKGEKSDIVTCLSKVSHIFKPEVDAVILDGAVIVNMIRPGPTCKTIADYAQTLHGYFIKEIENVGRLDLVFDVYIDNSLKASTREKRGHGNRIKVSLKSRIPSSWQNFLKDDLNKQELFKLLADHLVGLDWHGKCFVVTRGQLCLSSSPQILGT